MSSTASSYSSESSEVLEEEEMDIPRLEKILFQREYVSLNPFYVPLVSNEAKQRDNASKDANKHDSSSESTTISHMRPKNSSTADRLYPLHTMRIPANRYAGVVYAARFFVTRVGFLRSSKRLMVLSNYHMAIIDPYTDEVKERHAYDDIKEITVAPDGNSYSAGASGNTERSFTIYLGKNIKETYTSRTRQHLLSAYYQLRERSSSSAAGSGIDIGFDTFSKARVSAQNLPRESEKAQSGETQNDNSASGMYFDNLFQLCGKTFLMTKLSSTKSTSSKPIKIQILLAVRASSLDRLDLQSRHTVSSILLIDIVKIQRVVNNQDELLIYYENNKVHRYWSDSRESFIQAISNNLRSWLAVTLVVEKVSDSCEFDAMTATKDIPQPVSFEIPVLKISKDKTKKLQLRWLAITSNSVIERAYSSRRTLATHSLSDIYNIVMYPSFSRTLNPSTHASATKKESNAEAKIQEKLTERSDADSPSSSGHLYRDSEGFLGKFAIELKHGRTRRFACLNAAIGRRDKTVSIGLMSVMRRHEDELRHVICDISGEYHSLPRWLRVPGSIMLMNPKEVRSLFFCNLLEMFRMNRLHLSISTEETPIACKEGTWGSEAHPEYEDILLRKLLSLHLVPNLVNQISFDNIYRQLEQFNRNISIGASRQRDRRAFSFIMKLLEQLKDYCVTQLHSPTNSPEAAIPSTELQVSILQTLQRLLCARGVFEEVPHSQYKNSIEIILELLHSPMEEVSFAAAAVIKYMVVNYSETRSMKSEMANRRAIFTKYQCHHFVSRAFDVRKHNRLGRIPTSKRDSMVSMAASSNSQGRQDNLQTANLTILQAELSLSGAQSLANVGLDFLVISYVLQTLEVCLSSGKKATPERVVRDLLNAMRIDEFSRHNLLFLFNRSLAFSIAKCSSILVKVHVLEQRSELVELLQDFARKHGALVWQLYMSLNGQDKAQRRISSQLLALLTHENPRSSSIIRRIFPHSLFDDMPLSQLEYDEFGRPLPAISVDAILKSSNSDNLAADVQADAAANAASMQAQSQASQSQAGSIAILSSSPKRSSVAGASTMAAAIAGANVTGSAAVSVASSRQFSGSVDITNATESGRSKVIMYGINTRSRLTRNAKCVVLLPEFFDRLWRSHHTKDLIWSSHCVEELLRKLEAELAMLDVVRLKYYFYLNSDPLAAGNVNEALVCTSFLMPLDNKDMELQSYSTHEHFECLKHAIKQQQMENYGCSDGEICYNAESLLRSGDARSDMELPVDKTKNMLFPKNVLTSTAHNFAQYIPVSFIISPDTSDAALLNEDESWSNSNGLGKKEGTDQDNRSDSEIDSPQGNPPGSRSMEVLYAYRSNSQSQNSTNRVARNYEHRHARNETQGSTTLVDRSRSEKPVHWKARTRRARRQIPRYFIAWNGNEFQVTYQCLEDEVKVGPYYLTNLLNDRGILVEDINEPEKFMTLLYYRLLAEERKSQASIDSIASEIDASDVRLLVLKVMIQLFERHYFELSSLMFLNHLISVSMTGKSKLDIEFRSAIIRSDRESTYKWPLVVRGNIVLFLDRVLSSAVNVARFLSEPDNVCVILELLQEVKPMLAKDSDSEEVYQGSSIAVEELVEEDEAQDGQVSEDGDEDVVIEEDADTFDANEAQLGVEVAESNGTIASLQANPDNVDEESATRITVVAEHCGAMSSSMIMQTCLSVLSRLIDCHTSEQEGSMSHDVRFPRHGRVTYFEGCGVSPISEIKRRLCEDQTLRFLVSLLDCQNRIVFRKTLGLIRLLVRHNEAVIPSLHATGLFYYLLRFAQDVDEMTVAARLISHIHLRQSKIPTDLGPNRIDANKDDVFSPDPLTQICMRSWLVRLLPVSMVAQLLRHGPRRFATSFFSDSNNPEVVWNSQMRTQLMNYIDRFLAMCVNPSTKLFSISEEDAVKHHEVNMALIPYPSEVHALQCYQYYLHNLLNENDFPEWPINDVASFTRALLDSIHCWVQPQISATNRAVSITDIVLLLGALALLLRRFPTFVSLKKLDHVHIVLTALDQCNHHLQSNATGAKYGDNDLKMYWKAMDICVHVINMAVRLSNHNAQECSSLLGLRVLCGALKTLDGMPSDCENMTTIRLLESLMNVLSIPNARVSAGTQSLNIIPLLTRYMQRDCPQAMATRFSLAIVHEMAQSNGGVAETLLLQLAEHGILWYVALLCLLYERSVPGSTERECNLEQVDSEANELKQETAGRNGISIQAANVLNQIMCAQAQRDSIVMHVQNMKDTIYKIFTRPLVDILRMEGPVSFLNILVSEVREPHVMWLDRMRVELLSVAQEAVAYHEKRQPTKKAFEMPSHFMYMAQKEELCVAGIYVNFYNENPQKGIDAQIAGQDTASKSSHANVAAGNGTVASTMRRATASILGSTYKKTGNPIVESANEISNSVCGRVMHGLLCALSQDMAGVRAEPQCLEAVLLPRLLPVATAIRHVLQHTREIDTQILLSDGISVLLYVLDHDGQSQAFSFSCAPLLQLRCMECLHMLSFSGRCIDGLANLVPPYIKSAFRILYEHLAKPDASTEGQLARTTLQLLGNLCLVPACIDYLVKGMNPNSLASLLPQIYLGDPSEMQLLLCVHMIPLKRHTQAATQFAKAAVSSQLANALLNLLSVLVPKSDIGDSTLTKSYAARFLSVLSSNPGSGGAISSLLIASRAWETHGDTTQGSTEDLRRLLVLPYAPMLLKSDAANPHRIG